MIDEQGAMAQLSQQSSREQAGTTSLGALLRAKLNDQDKS
jgi:small subunit ribosomal protein S1